jgi:shikimate kinase
VTSPLLIVLIGPPGAGKTHLGQRIQTELGYAFRDVERELLERYGSRAAFVQDKSAALAALEADVRARLASSDVPVVIESTGLSDAPMLARVRQEFAVLWIKVHAPRDVCMSRVQRRAAGGNLSNDARRAGEFHDFWLREVEPCYCFDLEVENDGSPDRAFLQDLAARVEGRRTT